MTRTFNAAARVLLGFGLAATLFVPTAEAKKSTFSVLYTFTGGDDGASPLAGLIADKQGNLYGTTWKGGADDAGTVFELAPNGAESVLLTFDITNGYEPYLGNLTADKAGNFFGTTVKGGNDYGIVYELAPDGIETVLYKFTGGSDAGSPFYDLVQDKKGNLYGTTEDGGANGDGTVFKVSPDGIETVLYSFCSQAGCTDGSMPWSQLIIDKSGNLYGTTWLGGTTYSCGYEASGCGTLFKLAPDGTETVLHTFAGGATDGCYPLAGVIADKSGTFYGTAEECGTGGDGTVFKVAPDGTETILHGFSGGSDGAWPWAALVEDSDGNLYGTTTIDGNSSANCYGGSCGTVFEIAPNGTETILHTFTGGSDGGNSYAALRLKGAWLYGTAENGGADGYGTVFKVKK
ncbi:MAG TPA: choice-of-anchor tandem repeat GloVer-containing protein [Rhizomicrobium sp.]|jgi:uncharacterized repeat protein (TIGR03803 family)|nr:choice-of-anchor tandem repeat GloVer-containing protein [Rhizomicrobium sp.]